MSFAMLFALVASFHKGKTDAEFLCAFLKGLHAFDFVAHCGNLLLNVFLVWLISTGRPLPADDPEGSFRLILRVGAVAIFLQLFAQDDAFQKGKLPRAIFFVFRFRVPKCFLQRRDLFLIDV